MASENQTTRVFLVGNAQKPELAAIFERTRAWLDRRGLLAGSDLAGQAARINDAEPELVIVLGGDGTILYAVQAMGNRQVPVVGVNLGKLGYLADFSVNELSQHIERIISDSSLVSQRMMLSVTVVEPDGTARRHIAVNDCVLRSGTPFRNLGFGVAVDGADLTTVIGDGLIIATPTGSTAHNMSCGGPIVQPEVEAIILTPMGPHSLAHRPIVIGPDVKLEVRVLPTNEGTHVVLDGQVVRPAPGGTRLTVQRAAETFQHVRNPNRRPWDTLVQKLKWGQKLVP